MVGLVWFIFIVLRSGVVHSTDNKLGKKDININMQSSTQVMGEEQRSRGVEGQRSRGVEELWSRGHVKIVLCKDFSK